MSQFPKRRGLAVLPTYCWDIPLHKRRGLEASPTGGHKEMSYRYILADQSNCGGRREGIAGPHSASDYSKYNCEHGVQINFGDHQDLTYGYLVPIAELSHPVTMETLPTNSCAIQSVNSPKTLQYTIPTQGCGSGSVSGTESAWIRINLSCWIRIQEGKNYPQK